MAVGIVGYGVYIPKNRIKRDDIAQAWEKKGRGENSVAGLDEDVITMSVEASENAVRHAGIDSTRELDALYLGTNSAPYVDHSSVGMITEVLGTKQEIDVADFAASPRASIAALKACSDAVEAGRINYGMVVGSDCQPTAAGSELEMSFGAAAAACVLGSKGTIADIEGMHTCHREIIDTWSTVDEKYVRVFEPRFTRKFGYIEHVIKAAQGLMSKLRSSAENYQHVIMQPHPDARVGRDVAQKLGVTNEQLTAGKLAVEIGNTGSSSPLVGLAVALDQAKSGDRILLLSYGSGTSDAISLKVCNEIEKIRDRSRPVQAYIESKEYINYMRFLKFKGFLQEGKDFIPMYLPTESAFHWRSGPELHRLIGSKCDKCGYINFPPSQKLICIRCGNTGFDQVLISRQGKITIFSVNHYMPPPFDAPLPLVIADMDDGSRYQGLGTEMRSVELEIDMPVELVLRRLTTERGITIYGYLFRPPRFEH